MVLPADLAKTLETLKDLEGILGSFLVAEGGAILAQDLPTYFGSAAYDVGPRAQRFHEALNFSGDGEFAYSVLRFGEHKVLLRKLNGALLAILLRGDTNMPALRMAMNLVAKKLSQQKWSLPTNHVAPAPPTVRPPADVAKEPRRAAPSLGAPEAATAPRPTKRALYFRGKRVQ